MWKVSKRSLMVATLAISLLAPGVGSAHPEGAFPSGRFGFSGSGTGPGMMGMGPGMMGMGFGMMRMMHGQMGMGSGMMGMGPGGMLGFGVSLTEDQQKKFVDIQSRFLKDSVKPQIEYLKTRTALNALLLNPSAKDEEIETLVKKASAAHTRLFLLRVRRNREIGKLYTPEQRNQMMSSPSHATRGMMAPSGTGNPCAPGNSPGR